MLTEFQIKVNNQNIKINEPYGGSYQALSKALFDKNTYGIPIEINRTVQLL